MKQQALIRDRRSTVALRPYQVEAHNRVMAELRESRSTLLVLFTGGGKTTIFIDIAGAVDGRVLIVAHRKELIDQAAARVHAQLGEDPEIERAELRAMGTSRIIVASKDSLHPARIRRLARTWTPSMIVVDEAHHCAKGNESYMRILDQWPSAKVVGVTATPDRADEAALGEVFESLAMVYEIDDGIRDGWLVPLRAKRVHIESVDLTAVKTVAGEYHQEQLDRLMAQESAVHRVVGSVQRWGEGLKSIVFVTSVETAKLTAEVFNHYAPGSAASLDHSTPEDQRQAILRAHRAGDIRHICNVGVLVEGYDDPGVSMIVNAAPTQSRARYAQRVGRGTRTLAGVIDGVDTPDARRAAIAASAKPSCLILDMVGSTADHRLVGPEDVLGGKLTDEVLRRTKDIIEREGGDISDAVAKAHDEIAERDRALLRKASKMTVNVRGSAVEFDPFGFYGIDNDEERWGGPSRFGFKRPTDKQLAAIRKFGMDPGDGLSKHEAGRLLDKLIGNAKAGRATFKQIRLADKFSVDLRGASMSAATRVIDAIKANGWRQPPRDLVNAILHEEPGSDG